MSECVVFDDHIEGGEFREVTAGTRVGNDCRKLPVLVLWEPSSLLLLDRHTIFPFQRWGRKIA